MRGSAAELASRFATEPPKGECVLAIGAAKKKSSDEASVGLDALLNALLGEGVSVKSAARIASETLDLPKNAAYKRAMELNNVE